jgi:site-specific DNA-methyltransferase (adenine-specific)
MQGMAKYPDKYFDLAIVDPPYGIGKFNMETHVTKNVKKWKYDWNDYIPDKNYFIELERVSKERIIWGANYYNCFNEKGGAIVWYKDVKHPNMSKCEIASYSRLKKVDFYRYDWSSTDKYNELKNTDIHPCQKPLALYKWLLTNYAKQGDKILDTHLGSGSSRIAAYDMGFDFVGFELDKDYFYAQQKRFNHFKMQGKLF